MVVAVKVGVGWGGDGGFPPAMLSSWPQRSSAPFIPDPGVSLPAPASANLGSPLPSPLSLSFLFSLFKGLLASGWELWARPGGCSHVWS